jgi:hypothetical protein
VLKQSAASEPAHGPDALLNGDAVCHRFRNKQIVLWVNAIGFVRLLAVERNHASRIEPVCGSREDR